MPFVNGKHLSDSSTHEKLMGLGFELYDDGSQTLDYIHHDSGIIIRDAHSRNFVTSKSGEFLPIDLHVEQVIGSLTSYSIGRSDRNDAIVAAMEQKLNRTPRERLRIYEAAKRRFLAVVDKQDDISDATGPEVEGSKTLRSCDRQAHCPTSQRTGRGSNV